MLWFKIGLIVFATFPALNKYVFKIENLENVKLNVRQAITSMQAQLIDGDYAALRDDAIEYEKLFTGKKDHFSQTGLQLVLLNLGNSYSFENKNAQAIAAYKRVLDEFPDSPLGEMVLKLIADNYFKLGILEPEEAEKRKAYRNAITFYTAVVLNRDEATRLSLFKDLQQKYPSYPMREELFVEDVIISIGKCYLRLEDADKGRAAFQLVAEEFEGSDARDNAQKLIGDSYLKQATACKIKIDTEKDQNTLKDLNYDFDKSLVAALRTYQDFVNKYPQSEFKSDVLIAMGETYFLMGKDVKGLAAFDEAVGSINVPEKQAGVQLRIGNYYRKTKQQEEAILNYNKVVKNFPDSKVAANAQYMIAKTYADNGQEEDEFLAYEKLTEFYKTSIFYAPAAYMLGQRSRDKQEYADALRYFKKGITLHPNSMVAHKTQYMIGLTLLDKQDYRQAIREFEYLFGEYESSLRRDDAENAWLQMATCYKNLDEVDKAHEIINRIQSHKNKIEAQKILGIDADDPDSKIAKWEESLGSGSDETDASVLFEIGKIHAKDNNAYETALTFYTDAQEKTTDPVKLRNINYFSAVAHFSLKHYEIARDGFKVMIEDKDTPAEMKIQCEFKVYDSYRRETEYDKAIDGFSSFIALHIDDEEEHYLIPYARFMVANCLKDKKEYDAAITEYFKVIDDPGLGDDAALAVGNAYKESGQIDDAINYWLEFMETNPDCEAGSQIYYQVGEAFRVEKYNDDVALDNYRIVYEQYPESYLFSAAAFQAGMIYVKRKKTQDARDILELVKKEDRNFYKAARAEIGKMMAAIDYKLAIKEYEQIEEAGEDDDDRALARMGIGDIYYGKKMFKRAVASFLVVLDEYTMAGEDLVSGAYIKLIDAYGNLRQQKNVIKYANRMIEQYPDNDYTINAYYFKANALYAQKKYKSAIKIFKVIIDLNRNPALSEISMYQSAECLMVQSLHDQALRAYDRFIAQYPGSQYTAMAIYQQGNAYWAKENYNGAFKKFKKVYDNHKKFSEYDQATAFLAYCYDKKNDWKTAKRLYQRVIKRNKSKNAVKFARGYLEQINLTH